MRTQLLILLMLLPAIATAQSVSGVRLGFSPTRSELGFVSRPLLLSQVKKTGNHAKTGAIVGGLAGAGAGLILVDLFKSDRESSDNIGLGPQALAAVLFGAVGAGIGALIGSLIKK